MVDSPSYMYFDDIVIATDASAGLFVIACVYRPSSSYPDAFCDELFNSIEYLPLVYLF